MEDGRRSEVEAADGALFMDLAACLLWLLCLLDDCHSMHADVVDVFDSKVNKHVETVM